MKNIILAILIVASAPYARAAAFGGESGPPTDRLLKTGDTMTGVLTMSGASANIVSDSSVTASGFFGDGSALTGIAGGETGYFAASKTFGSSVTVNSEIDTKTRYKINGSTAIAFAGVDSVLVGSNAGRINTTNRNVFIGNSAGYSSISTSNTFVGYSAGYGNTGTQNVFLGQNAGQTSGTSHYGVFVGNQAGYSNTTANGNIFIGHEAGYFNTTGVGNVHIGYLNGRNVQTNSGNTTLGYYAGGILSGSRNLLLGYQSADNLSTGSDNIVIGYNLDVPSVSTNSYMSLGDTIYGNLVQDWVGIGTNTASGTEKLRVMGGILTASSITASAFFGDGSALTGIKILGVTDGSNATAGYVGEYISTTTIDSRALGASSAYVTIATTTLTPGDWDVSGNAYLAPGGSFAATFISACVSLAASTCDLYDSFQLAAAITGANNINLATPTRRISITVNTPVYLTAAATYSVDGGTTWYAGRSLLRARRVR